VSTCSRLISTETGFATKCTSPGCNTALVMVTEKREDGHASRRRVADQQRRRWDSGAAELD